MLQKQILVTGAAGYVGSVLCRQLLGVGHRVLGLDVLLFGDAGIQELHAHPRFTFLHGDLCDAKTRRKALQDVDQVVHLAAIVGDPACKKFPDAATALMDVASRALFEEAAAAGIQRFVFASTCSNYGQMADGQSMLTEDSPLLPQSHYARLKVGFEEYLLAQMATTAVAVTILRFATAYGLSPRMRFDLTVNHFTRDLTLGRELLVFGQHQWRPYCHVQDLASSISLAVSLPHAISSGVFNIGDTQENYTKGMIVEHILKVVPGGKVSYGPQPDVDSRNYRVSFEKAFERLHYFPLRDVPKGIKEIHAALKNCQIRDPFAAHYENC